MTTRVIDSRGLMGEELRFVLRASKQRKHLEEKKRMHNTHRDAKRSRAHSLSPTDVDLFFLQPSFAKRGSFLFLYPAADATIASVGHWRYYYEMKDTRSANMDLPFLPFRILSKRIETLLKSSCVCWTLALVRRLDLHPLFFLKTAKRFELRKMGKANAQVFCDG